MSLKLYNTFAKKEETFVPLHEGKVTMYTCGPTVYGRPHIGNYSSFLMADLLRRWLEVSGYAVTHVKNITDVGHLVADQDEGEDKIERQAREEKADPLAIARKYTEQYLADEKALNMREPEERPKATEFVGKMIEIIRVLVDAGHAYETSDGVYFAVESFPDYGKLSGNTLEQLNAGARIDVKEEKKHPADFALWKKTVGANAHHILKWPSPWGDGFPGWHIECSAMARALLGARIDIHTGGEDNIFPHHECEVAQSCCASGRPTFSRYWFHTRYLQVEGQKMSKSKGNFFTARDLFAKGVTPAALRLELVRTHYRTNSNFTMQGLQDCQRMIDRWSRAHAQLVERAKAAASAPSKGHAVPAQPAGALTDESRAPGPFELGLAAFTEALCDDLNVARAVAALNEAVGAAPAEHSAADPVRELASLLAVDSVLGVLGRNAEVAGAAPADDPAFVAQVDALLARRAAARAAKNWAESDAARDALTALGVAVKDGPQGQTWARV